MTDQLDEKLKEVVVEPTEEIKPEEGQEPSGEIEAEEQTVVTFGDDEPQDPTEHDSKRNKKFASMRKENRELKEKLEKVTAKADDNTALGAEPTLEDCDYDADKYRDTLRDWDRAKAKQDAKVQTAEDAQKDRNKVYAVKLDEYHASKSDFDADSFDEAEGIVKDTLNNVQLEALVTAFSGRAAPLIQALGQDEKKLTSLSKHDLSTAEGCINFAVEATRLESAMKISSRKPRTVPETRVSGNASSVSGDNQLEKLREAAAKTGDMSKVLAYKRSLKAS